MFSLLYLGAKLLAEKGAENKAQYQIDKKHREIAQMDLWDGLEKQIIDRHNFYHPNLPVSENFKSGVYWRGDKNNWKEMTLKTVRINREYHNSGLTQDEFLKKFFLEMYQSYVDRSMEKYFYNKQLELYDKYGNRVEFTATKRSCQTAFLEITKNGKEYMTIPLE